MQQQSWYLSWAVWIAALGYFVDIYDLTLFSIVRVPSLAELGLLPNQMLTSGVWILNMQMSGMLLGGLAWGVWADKKGRRSVLWLSILLYSLANIANAFVWDEWSYGIIRFIAGFGLAGELGIGLTLVSESLPTEQRGLGALIVASLGVSGAVFGFLIAEWFNWRVAYIMGGVLGLCLLLLRMQLRDSPLFRAMEQEGTHSQGHLWMLFNSWPRFVRYVRCILLGLPLWAVVGVVVTFSPEIASALAVEGKVSAAKSMMLCYTGLVFGDILSCSISQLLKSRKKALVIFLTLNVLLVLAFCIDFFQTTTEFYLLMFSFGIACGYWALFVTVAAESFGTNLRATVTTSVPNMVRGSVVLLTLSFTALLNVMPIIFASATVVLATLLLAYIALWFMPETFSKSLDFYEG